MSLPDTLLKTKMVSSYPKHFRNSTNLKYAIWNKFGIFQKNSKRFGIYLEYSKKIPSEIILETTSPVCVCPQGDKLQ
jgi:hypothetical protein